MTLRFDRAVGHYVIEDAPEGYRKEIDLAEALLLAKQITHWAHIYMVCEDTEKHIESQR